MPTEKYLGDGFYVAFDGYTFCLRAPREGGDHYIYLDPEALNQFIEYVNMIGALRQKTLQSGAKSKDDGG